MQSWKRLLVGIVAVGLVGCTNSASTSSPPSSAGRSSTAAGTTEPTAAQVTPLPAGAKADARSTAAQFDSLYFASRYAASWYLLAPDARRQVPKNVWIKVHEGCPAAASGVTRSIKAVTVFGNTAIVTETIVRAHSSRNKIEYVFYYMDGHWGYSPLYPGVYHRGSIAADISAAKAADLCGSWKSF